VFVDAQCVFGFPGAKHLKLGGQVGHVEHDSACSKSYCSSALASAAVEIDLRRFESESCADPQGDVIDSQFPDAKDGSDAVIDEVDQLTKGLGGLDRLQVPAQPPLACLKSHSAKAPLVKVPSAARICAERGSGYSVLIGSQSAKVLQFLLGPCAVAGDVVGSYLGKPSALHIRPKL
jgi:hypothetical protein